MLLVSTKAGRVVLAAMFLSSGSLGCQQQSNPVNFQLTVPNANVIDFQATLTQHYGIGLAGSFNLPNNIGQVILNPETSNQGFGLGFTLNTRAFLQSSWVGFQEVSALPTGAPFPSWMAGPVVDVTSPALNGGGVDYHFYFGDHSQYYVGVAGVIHAINQNFPAVNIGYTFYDTNGHVVVGFQFFGPQIGPNGQLLVPGGIFIGTNLTPLLPASAQPAVSASAALGIQSAELMSMAQHAIAGKPVVINGRSVISDIQTQGTDAHRYRTRSSIKGLIDRYMAASRTTY